MNKLTRFATGIALALVHLTAAAQAPKVVISQVYGGAGCGTAGCSSYKNDFIELFNSGDAPQSLNGWSIQYTAASGTAWQVTLLTNVTLQPGQYYLIAQGAGSNGVNNIPTPDASGTIAMSATSGKVALLSSTTALSGTCPVSAAIEDFVGYGGAATCNEGGANVPATSTTTAAIRGGNGCTDDNVNGTDFSVATPNPRNTASATAPCVPLPVTFISFNAQYRQETNSVTLSWSTSLERNAKEFVVERSTDGKAWTSVQHIAAAGNTSSVTQYEAIDKAVREGVNLYRIRQQDMDGSSQYTRTIGVTAAVNERSYFNVFPNPTTGTIRLSATLPTSAAATIRVLDVSGRVVLQDQKFFDAAASQMLDLSRLEKGTYFLTISSDDYSKTEKVFLY